MSDKNLKLPQQCTPAELDARKSEVASRRGQYEFDHSWAGYPPSLLSLPWRETEPGEALEAEARILATKVQQEAYYAAYELKNGFGEGPPFEKFSAIFTDSTLPMVGLEDRWQQDAVFAMQRLSGMYPWFIRRVMDLGALQQDFPITDAMVQNLLPAGETLASLQQQGKLYFISHPELDGAPPAHEHVMTAPTTLFTVNEFGQLMPLGIQLYPKTTPKNPIFTANSDPATWLAVRIHASCSDTLVHAIYSHAILMHFVMSNVWTAANRTLPAEHPVYAFLEPHFWGTLFITHEVKGSMNSASGSQSAVYGTGLAGQNHMVSDSFKTFNFGDYNPEKDFAARGVDDKQALPEFYYRDDALWLWEVDKNYVASMLGLFYSSDADVQNDTELQAWVAEMASAKGAGIVGLPVNAAGKLETREALYEIVTSVLFSVTSRHSSIENGAVKYAFPPANPFVYRLAAPTDPNVKLELADVSRLLAPMTAIIDGWALIESANYAFQDNNRIGAYPAGFTDGWPASATQLVAQWRAKLDQIAAAIDDRNQRLSYPYTALSPRNTFNSIWN